MLSSVTTPQDLDERFRAELSGLTAASEARDPATPVREGTWLIGEQAARLFDAQLASRHLDLAARWLRSFDAGYYTVASSGHEGNAAVAAALNLTDPALLHGRSGAFYCARAGQVAGSEPIRDVLRGLIGSTLDPIAGGRQKVLGHPDLHVLPTTSADGSHLPRAVGLAWAIGHGGRLHAPTGYGHGWPPDSIVVASFSDASLNRAPATAALNTAGWLVRDGQHLPLLLVCEDAATAGSPKDWAETTLRARPGIRYFAADGCDLPAAYDAATEAAAWVRQHRQPAVLHLSMVCLIGDGDIGSASRSADEMTAQLRRDPLLATARLLVEAGVRTVDEVLARYDETGWEVRRVAEEVLAEPKLTSADDIIATLAPRRPGRVARAVAEAAERAAASPERADAFGGTLPEDGGPLTLAQSITAALTDAMIAYPQATVFGADVTGGGSLVTRHLPARFGDARVFDTVPDETSILGLALGSGLAGLLPMPEIRYLSYLHGAEDQLRGQAATMQFFSQGAYRNPMVLRVAGLADRTGLGGHLANDNAVAVLRDVPGLVVAVPARGDDAAAMLRTCLASALVDGSVCVFLEPAALYETRDLYADGDGEWLTGYTGPGNWAVTSAPIGRARVYPGGGNDELTIITYGSGVRLSRRAAAQLAAGGVSCRVVDLRWLSPLPVADIIREAAATGRVLVVDETRRSGGVGEGVIAALVDAGYVGVARRLAAVDSFIPLGPAVEHLLVSEEQIVQGARSVLGR
jgi:2-oxoisovalerate dehydrogenase E1 component